MDSVLNNECVKNMYRYLAAYKVVEGDYGLFDKLSRIREIKDFLEAINVAMRVKDRVISKLIKGANKDYEVIRVTKEGKTEVITSEEEIRKIYDVGSHCIDEILKLAEKDPKLLGLILSSLALAYGGVREKSGERKG